MIEAKRISFQEAWDNSINFFVDEELEQEIESEPDFALKSPELLLNVKRDQELQNYIPRY